MADTARQVGLAQAQYIRGDIEVDEFERIVWAVFHLGARVHVYRYDGDAAGALNENEAYWEWLMGLQLEVRFAAVPNMLTIDAAPWRRQPKE